MKPIGHESAMLRPKDAAVFVGLSVATLARMRVEGSGPPFVALFSSAIGYDPSDLAAWLASRPRFRSNTARQLAEAATATP